MPTIEIIDLNKKKVGTLDLDDSVFSTKVNYPLVHQVIKGQLATRRQGTAKTLTKSEVRGGGKKPFKQKGTGNARQGSTRSSLNVGGGQNFGPRPRCYFQGTPKEMVRGALRSALSDRFFSKRLLVVDEFNLSAAKTKVLFDVVRGKFALTSKVLVIDETNKVLEQAGKNIPNLKVLRTDGLNTYDLVKYEWIVVSKKAVQAIEARLTTSGN